jgi:chromosome segregation ATPase
MVTRAGALIVATGYFAGMLGCVSADVYRIKEQEAQTLQRTNQEMQEQNRSLIAERTELQTRSAELKNDKEELNARIEKLNGAIVYLQNRAEKLEKDGDGLKEHLEKLNAKIADLNKENQRLATLTRPENLLRTLGERLADLQKQVEALGGENKKLKSRQVIARPEEEGVGGAEAEKIGSASEKPQAVQVSAGQRTADSKPDQQQDEPKQPFFSEDRDTPSGKP